MEVKNIFTLSINIDQSVIDDFSQVIKDKNIISNPSEDKRWIVIKFFENMIFEIINSNKETRIRHFWDFIDESIAYGILNTLDSFFVETSKTCSMNLPVYGTKGKTFLTNLYNDIDWDMSFMKFTDFIKDVSQIKVDIISAEIQAKKFLISQLLTTLEIDGSEIWDFALDIYHATHIARQKFSPQHRKDSKTLIDDYSYFALVKWIDNTHAILKIMPGERRKYRLVPLDYKDIIDKQGKSMFFMKAKD